MKIAIIIHLSLISICSFGQQSTDKFVTEVSPLNASMHAGFYLNIQGKLSYTFNKHLSVSVRHNQELLGGLNSAVEKLNSEQLRRNSLTDLNLGITLYNSKKPRIDPTEEALPRTWINKLLQLDLGAAYYKYANKRPDYYTYDTDDQGNYKIINSINRLSASLGFSFIIRENTFTNPDKVKLKRQHTISAGAYYGIHYDLQGIVKMEGSSPAQRAPKNYSFNRNGYYLRYNFRQQLNEHLFIGVDLLWAKMPRVNYTENPEMPFLLRGGESEPKFQPYAGITAGWAF